MQILQKNELAAFDAFSLASPHGYFMQSSYWAATKPDWGSEFIVSRGKSGEIAGAMLVLVKKVPGLGSYLYAPRGPVCDLLDDAVLDDLLAGVSELARRHRAFSFVCDPLIEKDDVAAIERLTSRAFSFTPDVPYGHATQPNVVHAIEHMCGKTEDELLASFAQKTRYNIRVAKKHGVACEVKGPDGLDDFYKLYQDTAARQGFVIRPKSYYENMLAAFGEHAKLYICYHDEKPLSAAFNIVFGERSHYMFGASGGEGRNLMPTYLMQWSMISDALAAGCDVYDFMGTPPVEDPDNPRYGLVRFKRGFGGREIAFAGEFKLEFSKFKTRLFGAAKSVLDLYYRIKKK